jgi:hypothetical protein
MKLTVSSESRWRHRRRERIMRKLLSPRFLMLQILQEINDNVTVTNYTNFVSLTSVRTSNTDLKSLDMDANFDCKKIKIKWNNSKMQKNK